MILRLDFGRVKCAVFSFARSFLREFAADARFGGCAPILFCRRIRTLSSNPDYTCAFLLAIPLQYTHLAELIVLLFCYFS
jgi:hypothetical protein